MTTMSLKSEPYKHMSNDYFKWLIKMWNIIKLEAVKHDWRILKIFLCLPLTVDCLDLVQLCFSYFVLD